MDHIRNSRHFKTNRGQKGLACCQEVAERRVVEVVRGRVGTGGEEDVERAVAGDAVAPLRRGRRGVGVDLGGVELPAGRVAGLDEGHLAGKDGVVGELRLRQRDGAASVDVLYVEGVLV